MATAMPRPGSFVDLCLRGDATPDDIDDFVGEWHDGFSLLPIHQYLGLTWAEYARWVERPDSLEATIQSRRSNAARNGREIDDAPE